MRSHAKASSAGSISNRRFLSAALFLALVVLFMGALAQAQVKVEAGSFGASGRGAGQLNGAFDLAINHSGAGGATADDVYLGDNGNSRIVEFSPTGNSGTFVRAWGWDVVASGQHNTGTNEQQTVTVKASAGKFSLAPTVASGAKGVFKAGSNVVTGLEPTLGSFHVGDAITAAAVVPANTTITAVGPGTLTLSNNATADSTFTNITATENTGATGTGNFASGGTQITGVVTRTGQFVAGELISGTGIQAGTKILAVGTGTLTIDKAAAAVGTDATLTATDIAYKASAAEVDAALESLLGVGSGGVSVSREEKSLSEFVFTITFSGGPLSGNDIAQMPGCTVATCLGLEEGTKTVTVVTSVAGGGFEICQAVSTPTDICKGGVESGNVGGMTGLTLGVAVDQANGNVYIADTNNRRIAAYSATGAFYGAFGWKVVAGLNGSTPEEKLQFCTAVTGCQVGTTGAKGGQFAQRIGRLSVDPSNGHLYVTNMRSARIDEFTPTLNGSNEVTGVSFVRSFGWDVVESGPSNANQIVAVNVSATAGTFKLSFGAQTTGDLAFNATSSQVQSALEALPSVGAGNVSVVGGPGSGVGSKPYGITFPSLVAGTLTASDGATPLSGGTAVQVLKVTTMNPGGGAGFEVCRGVDICKAGTAGSGAGQFSTTGATTGVTDVAVGGDGIYTVDESTCTVICRVQKFDSVTLLPSEFAPADLRFVGGGGSEKPTRIAIDPATEQVFVVKQTTSGLRLYEFDSAGVGNGNVSPAVAGSGLASAEAVEVANPERVYVLQTAQARVAILAPAPPPSAQMTSVTGVTSSQATFNGKVTIPSSGGPGFEARYQFEYSVDSGFNWKKAPTPVFEIGNGEAGGESSSCPTPKALICNVSQVVTGLQPGANYLVRITATTSTSVTSPTIGFTTAAAAPSTNGQMADPVTATTAKLYAYVNPNNRATTYRFDWGTETSYGKQAPAEFEPFAGSGPDPVKVSATVTGLAPSTTYHFRVVATNVAGTTNGPDMQFMTLNASGVPDLPDNRGFELVSPADKHPQGAVRYQLALNGPFQASEDGESVLFPLLGGLEDTDSGGDTAYLAKRSSSSWSATKVTPPSLVPNPSSGLLGNASPGMVTFYSPDLSCGVVETFSPLTADTPTADIELGMYNFYVRNEDGTHRLITSTVPSNPEFPIVDGLGIHHTLVAGASPDCRKVYFESAYDYLPNATGLYEWDDGTLRDAGRLPNGALAVGAPPGIGGRVGLNAGSLMNSVSRDGSRFFFSAISNEAATAGKGAVFVREGEGAVVEASRKQGGSTDSLGARYEVASRDGSHLFLLATYGLTPASSSGPAESCFDTPLGGLSACDLYDYDLETGELTDLSATTDPANSKGAVVNGVIAASENGESVYFAARGQLLSGKGKTYAQNISGAGSANVYLARDGQLKYVTTIPAGDLERILVRASGRADVTPDGDYLLFETRAGITGYESGGVREAYLYSATDDTIACISCRPDGLPSVGEVGLNEILPLNETFREAPPGWQVRLYKMSEDGGRVFFTSPDVLAPGAVAGNINIYEWGRGQVFLLVTGTPEVTGLDGLQTKLYGASRSGDDVFIRTPRQLTPYDTDVTFDLYDVRVGGGFAPPPPAPVPCDPAADECQGALAGQPGSISPASAGFAGPGNPAPPALKQAKKKAKKAKKRHRKNTKRANRSRAANAHRGGVK